MGLHSPLQIQVLTQYRILLKWAAKKQGAQQLRTYIQKQFRENQQIPRKQFNRIEFLLRQAKNKYEVLKDAEIDSIK